MSIRKILFLLVAGADIEQTANVPAESAGDKSLECNLIPHILVSLDVNAPSKLTEQRQSIARTSRARVKEKMPVDRLSLELCWWAVKELAYGRKSHAAEDSFVIETTDLVHVRLYMATAVHSLGRTNFGSVVEDMSSRHMTIHPGIDQ